MISGVRYIPYLQLKDYVVHSLLEQKMIYLNHDWKSEILLVFWLKEEAKIKIFGSLRNKCSFAFKLHLQKNADHLRDQVQG